MTTNGKAQQPGPRTGELGSTGKKQSPSAGETGVVENKPGPPAGKTGDAGNKQGPSVWEPGIVGNKQGPAAEKTGATAKTPDPTAESRAPDIYITACAPIPDPAPLLALMPPARRARLNRPAEQPGPLLAYALLALAIERRCGLRAAEAVAYTKAGKPHLPGLPFHLTISHTKTHVLAAIADYPIGGDIETRRPISEKLPRRVLSETEDPAVFFDHWVLKESHIKLTGGPDRPLSAMAFHIAGDRATSPDAQGWLLRGIPNCNAALLANHPFPRPEYKEIPPVDLLAWAAEK